MYSVTITTKTESGQVKTTKWHYISLDLFEILYGDISDEIIELNLVKL